MMLRLALAGLIAGIVATAAGLHIVHAPVMVSLALVPFVLSHLHGRLEDVTGAPSSAPMWPLFLAAALGIGTRFSILYPATSLWLLPLAIPFLYAFATIKGKVPLPGSFHDGDVVALKQLKLGSLFTAIGFVAYGLAKSLQYFEYASESAIQGVAHIGFLSGFLLLTYGISHVSVARLSTVPAIAPGAMKGELHSTLLATVALPLGIGFGITPVIVLGGASAFIGVFTWMGVLGANIMRNKSPTQRVTPVFVYVPWVFSGVLWVVCAVLLGMFQPAASKFPQYQDGIRMLHVHSAFLAGMVQIFLGFLYRQLPEKQGEKPLPFHQAKWPFYLFNLAWILLVIGQLQNPELVRVASLTFLLSLLLVAYQLKDYLMPKRVETHEVA